MHIVVFRKSNPNYLYGRFVSMDLAEGLVLFLNDQEADEFVAFDTTRWQSVYPVEEDCSFQVAAPEATTARVVELRIAGYGTPQSSAAGRTMVQPHIKSDAFPGRALQR